MAQGNKPLHIQWCAKDALDGMLLLSEDEELAYRRLLDLIYATDDNLPNDDRELARLTRMGRKWKKVKASLLQKKEALYLDAERQVITHDKCQDKLEIARRSIQQKKDAVKAREKKREERKNNDLGLSDDTSNDQTNDRPPDTSVDPSNLKPLTPLSSPFDFLNETHRSIFIRLEELIEAQWPNAPPNFDSRLLADTAKDFAEQGATVDIVNATIPPILRRIAEQRSTPPADLTAFRGEIVQAVRHWVQAKRDRWKPEWGPEPPADVMARFEIPALYRLPGESAAPKPRPKPKYAPGEEFGEIPDYLKREATNA